MLEERSGAEYMSVSMLDASAMIWENQELPSLPKVAVYLSTPS
jgi:hypothetical protein